MDSRQHPPRRPVAARWLAGIAALALTVAGLATPTPAQAESAGTDGGSTEAVSHQMPFPCGQTWSGQTRSYHSPKLAIDLNRSGDFGDPVVASAAGRVVHRGHMSGTGYGRLVVIRHSDGRASYYAHLSAYSVRLNDWVSQGQRIGKVGSSGNSSGAHLHYEQRYSYNGSVKHVVWNGSRVYYYGTRNYTSNNCGGGNPYTPKQVCGSNYNVINSHGLSGHGRVYLLYNPNNGYNCVVTMKRKNIGTPTWTMAFLEPQGSSRSKDAGYFSYYAGPVKRYAAGTCVKWGGRAGGNYWASPFEHCGG